MYAMRSSDDVFQLIHSLSKSEKRYFKLTASMQRGEKNYLRLFDVLNDMEEYNEEAVRAHFTGERFINQLNVAKRYLYDLILKSLRAFHTDYSPRAEVRELLTSADILREKGLSDQALRLVEKAITIAREHEMFNGLIDAYSTQTMIVPESQLTVEQIDERFDAVDVAVDQLGNLQRYRRLISRIGKVQYNGQARTREDFELLEKNRWDPLMDSPDNARSLHARFFHLAVIAHYEYEHGNYEALVGITDQQLALFNEHPWLKTTNPLAYIATLGNRALMFKVMDQRDRYRAAFEELERNGAALLAHNRLASPRLRANLFATMYISLLNYHRGIGTFEEAAGLMASVDAGLNEHAQYLQEGQMVRLLSSAAEVQFGRGKYRSALDYSNRLLAMDDPKCAAQVHEQAHLHNLFIHYELGNFDLLDSLIPATTRFFATRGKLERFERTVLTHMGRLVRATSDTRRRSALSAFRAELEDLRDDPASRTPMNYFNYEAWVAAKLERRSFADAVQVQVAMMYETEAAA